jgi:hypothetical protein
MATDLYQDSLYLFAVSGGPYFLRQRYILLYTSRNQSGTGIASRPCT